MSEAEAVQPDPQPTAEPAAPPAKGITLDFERLDAGDLEDMEDYCGRPVLGLLQEAMARIPEGMPMMAGLMAVLPAKVFTALLGVAKRHQDPEFGPDRWRSIKLTELAADEAPAGPFEEPAAVEEAADPGPTPIRGPAAKRAARPSGSPSASRRG